MRVRDFFQGRADCLRRQPQFVVFLQVHPDIRPGAEPAPEAQELMAGAGMQAYFRRRFFLAESGLKIC
jgi:hypothetical protein